MKRITVSIVVIAISVVTVAFAAAQQSGQPHGGMQPPPSSGAKPGATHDHDAHHAQEMCRQMMTQQGMMGGAMGPGMMRDGMMGPSMMGPGMMPMMMGGDPKQQAEMMAMRGEMMKAMGDIMLKYAQRAQSGK